MLSIFFMALNCVELSDIDLPHDKTFYYDKSLVTPSTTEDVSVTTNETTSIIWWSPSSSLVTGDSTALTTITTAPASPPSAPTSITALQIAAPPTSISVAQGLQNQLVIKWSVLPTPNIRVKVQWDYVPNSTFYKIYRSSTFRNVRNLIGTLRFQYVIFPKSTVYNSKRKILGEDTDTVGNIRDDRKQRDART